MNWIVFGVQWLHVLLGIIWFGNALVVAVILIPSLNPLPIPTQREVGSRYGERATRLFDVIVPVVILLGFVRGTFLGPIKGIDDVFGTAYGITWLVALIAAILTFVWGKIAINGAVQTMNAAPLNPDGTASVDLTTATDRVKLVVVLELLGFLVIFTSMILMRFGL
jgi:putative copper export protein